MCEKCKDNHQIGYYCPCECHYLIDKTILDRDKKEGGKLKFQIGVAGQSE